MTESGFPDIGAMCQSAMTQARAMVQENRIKKSWRTTELDLSSTEIERFLNDGKRILDLYFLASEKSGKTILVYSVEEK